MAKKNYYAIKKGIQCNVIVKTWFECEALVKGYSGAVFKGFTNKLDADKYLKQSQNKQRGVDTRKIEPSSHKGDFVPATEKQGKYGYFNPLYYMKNGVRHADYGRTIGINYVPYTGDDSVLPWLDKI